jgi:hypothetical protein
MSREPTGEDAFEQAVANIPSCALDETGMREQRARYSLLAGSVTRIEREPDATVIYFDQHLDRQVLRRALAVERECCPFFDFAFDEQDRRLRATVTDTDQLPALDAVAHALGAADRRTQQAPR